MIGTHHLFNISQMFTYNSICSSNYSYDSNYSIKQNISGGWDSLNVPEIVLDSQGLRVVISTNTTAIDYTLKFVADFGLNGNITRNCWSYPVVNISIVLDCSTNVISLPADFNQS